MLPGLMPVWIKICGVTSVADAELAVSAGADAVGVNLVPSSKRFVDEPTARAIAAAVSARVEVVAVVADRTLEELRGLPARLGLRTLQLHGSEEPALVAALGETAYQAVRIGTASDVARARQFTGERLLADAKVEGALGGTGHVFDWSLVAELGRERALVLAGGLTADNVALAVERVRPYGVDTASGVESGNPRAKDRDKVFRFVAEARRAAAALDLR
ncbi:MAG TPA: phosphoribosylanthranilate isomerase [Polyangiaceae bacterium]|jgi:phosphoribosylanthranilate isomerase|nr:phosphoribosylanthranilate isomerase [Polyangiaceae bacterium]